MFAVGDGSGARVVADEVAKVDGLGIYFGDEFTGLAGLDFTVSKIKGSRAKRHFS